jgi:hypothetical protein
VDFSLSCLVVALAEFSGVLESAFVGGALDKRTDGPAKFDECSQGDSSNRGDSPERSEYRRASRGAKCLIYLFRLRFVLIGHEIRAAICRPNHAASVAQAAVAIQPIRQPISAVFEVSSAGAKHCFYFACLRFPNLNVYKWGLLKYL